MSVKIRKDVIYKPIDRVVIFILNHHIFREEYVVSINSFFNIIPNSKKILSKPRVRLCSHILS